MALRDQPYFPLFVQDFLTDEKLIECSASATGVYIRIMCLMHKSQTYGKILLRSSLSVLPQQNEQQNILLADMFAVQLDKHLPYSVAEISSAIAELLTERVLTVEFGDCCYLVQLRMVKDNELSSKRAASGKKGADKTNAKFAAAKTTANTEYEYEYKEVDESKLLEGGNLAPKMVAVYKEIFKSYPIDLENDFRSCIEIAQKIADFKKWKKSSIVNGKMDETLDSWRKIVEFSANDKWFSTRTIGDLNKPNEWQRLIKAMTSPKKQEQVQPTAPPLKRLNP